MRRWPQVVARPQADDAGGYCHWVCVRDENPRFEPSGTASYVHARQAGTQYYSCTV